MRAGLASALAVTGLARRGRVQLAELFVEPLGEHETARNRGRVESRQALDDLDELFLYRRIIRTQSIINDRAENGLHGRPQVWAVGGQFDGDFRPF